MKMQAYLYEKLNILFVNAFSAIALTVFLKMLGLENGACILILLAWSLILAGVLLTQYLKWRKKYREMEQMLDGLDRKYLLFELLSKPTTQLEKLYYEMLYEGNKSMAEEVQRERYARESYKEYIEEWIHEVKTPLTAAQLICDNHPSPETRRLKRELRKTESLVEQALFYARSEVVEKDYFIQETELFALIRQVVLEYREILLEKKIRIEMEEEEVTVFTDEKWALFIIKQIISNAVKYAGEKDAAIRIYARRSEKNVRLVIEDNGKGISGQDLPRVFEKGFTGGDRGKQKATGLGLYLAKKLCDKLGLSIEIASEPGAYTQVCIGFPVGTYNFVSKQEELFLLK